MSVNLKVNERRALDETGVICDTEIVIKIGDKGNTLVLMDESIYPQTKTYCTADNQIYEKIMSEIKFPLNRHRSSLTEK